MGASCNGTGKDKNVASFLASMVTRKVMCIVEIIPAEVKSNRKLPHIEGNSFDTHGLFLIHCLGSIL